MVSTCNMKSVIVYIRIRRLVYLDYCWYAKLWLYAVRSTLMLSGPFDAYINQNADLQDYQLVSEEASSKHNLQVVDRKQWFI